MSNSQFQTKRQSTVIYADLGKTEVFLKKGKGWVVEAIGIKGSGLVCRGTEKDCRKAFDNKKVTIIRK
jgi:hypothetical protein